MPNWPNHFPEGCPPAEASDPDGELFRFTNRRSPNDRDFLSHYEKWPNRDWEDKACQARGLSVFRTMTDCLAMEAAVPAMKKKHIAVASLSVGEGVVAKTPSENSDQHHTLWSQLSISERCAAFSPVERPESG